MSINLNEYVENTEHEDITFLYDKNNEKAESLTFKKLPSELDEDCFVLGYN